MMSAKLKNAFAKIGAAALFGLMATSGAQATYGYNYFDVLADPGSYGPVSLGDSVSLDACGSTFHRADGNSQSYSICDLSNLQNFTLGWIGVDADNTSNYQILSWFEGSNVTNGLQTTISTGAGTFFSQAGNYLIGLYVAVAGNVYVPLPYGSYGATGNDTELTYDGSTNTSLGYTNFTVNAATSVPEPAAALMLLPAFVLVARRERRRRQSAKALTA
ncbi:hypothetical protein [Kordiimonas gwangyangensis]|uniref:hypothetical protein n=1 Tax=Kordiimonas gwangyangensis TaxID=288022 RepID=UPI00036FCDE3|nr:hypothetical protein [Kordiimonas gwangyangensis]